MTDKTSGAPRILGRLRAEHGVGVVRLEDRYDTGIDDLWAALTEPERLARWYGSVAGDLRPGGEFRTHIAAAGLDATGRVEECEPPRRLVVSTRETDESYGAGQGPPPFDEIAEATLTEDGDQTLLVVEVRGIPLDVVAAYGAGWQMHLESLAAYLTGAEAAADGERWGELIPAYADQAAALTADPPGATSGRP